MLQIHTVPAFTDNYLWLFHAQGSTAAYVVDPGDAAPVEQALDAHGLELAGILITHHHFDHTGGIPQLTAGRGIPVWGPADSKTAGIDHPLREGDSLEVAGARFEVIEVPGHTLDHIAYHCADEGVLFCGDTLFAGGCGRLFEGTPEQMSRSLAKLAALPGTTRVYCAHEYTQANLRFAAAVEPDNADIASRVSDADALRARAQPTVPSTIELELRTNPFLRCDEADVIRSAAEYAGRSLAGPADVLAAVRGWKDGF